MEQFVRRVKKGESLLELCRRCRLSPWRVIRENRLSEEPAEGELLYISEPPKRIHIAAIGETYDSIAARYGTSREKLSALNENTDIFWGMPVVIEK